MGFGGGRTGRAGRIAGRIEFGSIFVPLPFIKLSANVVVSFLRKLCLSFLKIKI